MVDNADPRVGVVSRALHTFHGRGYCTMGSHLPGLNFYCYDEARAILDALDGGDTSDYPDGKPALTLSGRQKKATRRKASQ